jgi:hypothetical protein
VPGQLAVARVLFQPILEIQIEQCFPIAGEQSAFGDRLNAASIISLRSVLNRDVKRCRAVWDLLDSEGKIW